MTITTDGAGAYGTVVTGMTVSTSIPLALQAVAAASMTSGGGPRSRRLTVIALVATKVLQASA